MFRFGVVAEGITDQFIIDHIVCGYLEDEDDEPVVNYLQPPVDKTGASTVPSYGGWGLVFDFLRRGEYKKALQTNDYIIIQIDTDVSQQVGYDVPWRESGRDLSPEELVARVVSKLERCVDAEFYAQYSDRFIFAVAVHSIECWLLPLFFENKKSQKITGCQEAVSHELRRKNQIPLVRGENKVPNAYRNASQPLAENDVLLLVYTRNPSLKIFVERLKAAVAAGSTARRTGNVEVAPSKDAAGAPSQGVVTETGDESAKSRMAVRAPFPTVKNVSEREVPSHSSTPARTTAKANGKRRRPSKK